MANGLVAQNAAPGPNRQVAKSAKTAKIFWVFFGWPTSAIALLIASMRELGAELLRCLQCVGS